ncbi:MAG TPA: retropepsin-like aspartic protease [bacterium]|nr:retropepsin-like aspartic protease [bacterium]
MAPHPFLFRQNQIYLPVTVGPEGQTGEFLLDTGASQTVVSTSFLGRARLPIAGVRGSQAMAIGGPIGHSVEGITLPSLTAAGETVSDLEVTQVNAHPLKQQVGHAPDGVLGVNFLRQFETTLHYPAQAIALRRLPGDLGSLDTWSRLGEDAPHILNANLRDGWLLELEARVAERASVVALLDLGSPRSILNWNAARALGYTPESPELRPGRNPLWGMDGRTITPVYAPPMEVALGPLAWPHSVLAIADMPIIRHLHIGYMPVLILGNDLLAQVELVFNYAMARVGLFLGTGQGD